MSMETEGFDAMLERVIQKQKTRDAEDRATGRKCRRLIFDVESDYPGDSIQEALKKAMMAPPVSNHYGEDLTEKPRNTRAPNNPWYNRYRR